MAVARKTISIGLVVLVVALLAIFLTTGSRQCGNLPDTTKDTAAAIYRGDTIASTDSVALNQPYHYVCVKAQDWHHRTAPGFTVVAVLILLGAGGYYGYRKLQQRKARAAADRYVGTIK